jgi:putative Mg2+ transporter-C (MgtC) family protein
MLDLNLINTYIDWSLIEVVVYSILCGVIFGLERLKRNKSIGIRTNIFVCLGSALFAHLSQDIPGVNDNSRVIAQIVSGIGFIGGGVIFKSFSSERLVGLTTASLLWVLAGIGVMIAVGKGKEALGITILIYIINVLTYKYEQYSYKAKRLKRELERKKKEIKLRAECFNNALLGLKTVTVRRGIKQYNIGRNLLVNVSNPSQKRNIIVTKIENRKYKDLDDKIAKKENYKDLKELKENFELFYPDIKDNDSVTVVYYHLKKSTKKQ